MALHFLPLLLLLLPLHSLSSPHTYIILVNPSSKPSLFPTHSHWYQSLSATWHSSSSSSPIIHTYSSLLHGFSARLPASAAEALHLKPGIEAVIPDRARSVETTRSPRFLGLHSDPPCSLLKESDFGADLVIAVLDTGISPGHRSFSDQGLGPLPTKWKGDCVAGPGFRTSDCNRKLVGARFFSGGYEATSGKMNETAELRSPRDTDGHGTHTASIAAGRYVFPASTLGYARGIASGMAPKARLAAYKVCWLSGCFDSDILAAFDVAVADGADVISLSVGGAVVPYFLDAIAIGAFAAAEAGVFVSASAGNGGPGGLSVTNIAPWVTTVGAGSMDRDFPADVKLGDGTVLPGVSVYGGPGLEPGKLYPLVYAGSGGGGVSKAEGYSSSLCLEGSLDENQVKGKIVVCDRGVNLRTAKGEVVRKAGGAGMILANGVFDGEGLVADSHVVPATAVAAKEGEILRKYISSAKPDTPPMGTIVFRGTRLGVRPAPVVAAFSARGPSPQSPDIIKPDLIAPGLNILAAWPAGVGPAGIKSDSRRAEFNILSGTSMACPHVSGLVALLKAAHPDWSPAAIKSALMTTAYVRDNANGSIIDESTGSPAGAFDFGSGHVDPQRAMDPGLIYDVSPAEYLNFLCGLNYTDKNIRAITRRAVNCNSVKRAGHAGNLNYPSFAVSFIAGGKERFKKQFIRTVTNVGGPSVYKAVIKAPEGSILKVEPQRLVFRRTGQKLSYVVRLEAEEPKEKLEPGSSRVKSGMIGWTDGRHFVNSPVVVSVQAPLE